MICSCLCALEHAVAEDTSFLHWPNAFWTSSETSSKKISLSVRPPPFAWGTERFPLLLPITQQRDCGCGYQVTLLCLIAVRGTDIHTLPGTWVGGSEAWDSIFRRKSGHLAKMLKRAHPLTATLRKIRHSFIYPAPVY